MKHPSWTNFIAPRTSLAALSKAERKARLAKRDAWIRRIATPDLFFPLMDLIPGVFFFAKDGDGRLMLMNRRMSEVYHVDDPAKLVGLSDFAMNPLDMAKSFVADDRAVIKTGKPLLNRLELWFDEMGLPAWVFVSKLPLRNEDGEIIGLMGITQSYRARVGTFGPSHPVTRAVEYMAGNYGRPIPLLELAKIACVSPRQLQRVFKAVFGEGPHEFLLKTRLAAACALIRETERAIGEIADTCGFSDQSSFNRHFKGHFGFTPRFYRLDIRKSA